MGDYGEFCYVNDIVSMEAYHNRTFINVGCWAHVRRKFVEALENDNEKLWKRYQKASKEEKKELIEENESLANKLNQRR